MGVWSVLAYPTIDNITMARLTWGDSGARGRRGGGGGERKEE